MPDITGTVHHVNLSVCDLERSVTWYAKVFDLSELTRTQSEDWSKVILRHPTGLLLGLTQHQRNDERTFDESCCGMDHLALAVPTTQALHEWESRLDELSIERSAVKQSPLGSLITIRDPDNIQLELFAPTR